MRVGASFVAGVALLLAVWGLNQLDGPQDGSWARPPGTAGPVRIIRFRANVGALLVGQKTQLCYGVAFARSVRIAPLAAQLSPAADRCLEIGPRHTTHYTLMAVGYDGSVATRSLTLAVQAIPLEVPEPKQFALAKKRSAAPAAAGATTAP